MLAFNKGLVLGIFLTTVLFLNLNSVKYLLHSVNPERLDDQDFELEQLDAFSAFYQDIFDKNSIVGKLKNFKNFTVLTRPEESGYSAKNERQYVPSNNNQISQIFRLLHFNRAFLADKVFLNEIKFKNANVSKSSDLDIGRVHQIDKIQGIDNKENVYITFGIGDIYKIKSIKKDSQRSLPSNCELKPIFTRNLEFNNAQVLASLYIICPNLIIQVVLFYGRGNFYWTSADDVFHSNQKSFGDKMRAVNMFSISQVEDTELNRFYVPSNIERFFFEYDHSEFVECNNNLARSIMKPNYHQDLVKVGKILTLMTYVTNVLESYRKHYFLAGGTLLGWYRDCGIIPHTSDMDLGLIYKEYDSRIKKKFIANQEAWLFMVHGLRDDMYEIRVKTYTCQLDMFLFYPKNSTHQSCGYHDHRKKYKRYYPLFDRFCSAELFGNKMMVPCDPVRYFEAEYGVDKWRTPISVKGRFPWLNFEYSGDWSDSEWPRVIKFYNKNGFDRKTTERHVRTYMKSGKGIEINDKEDEL